ncbi:MAG: protein translocase subunit SecD [Candidatus Nanopelagicaceae bacterium]|nr:protein translocase subunit SecD [Candidatus Nanopelagicaceae bacterium]
MSYANNQRNSGDVKKARPARAITVTVLLTAVLFGLAGAIGATTINLGLDLRGGTSVTLQPRLEDGAQGEVTAESIDQAVAIIRQRVNSLGVVEAEVAAEGTGTNRQIVISVPGETGRRIVDLVGQTAELRFRQVLVEAGAVPTPDDATLLQGTSLTPEQESAFKNLDCSKVESTGGASGDLATELLVTCDRLGSARYVLAPAQVIGSDIKGATAAIDQQTASGWFVSLDFTGDGTKKFGSLTQSVVNLPSPQNQVAIVLDGVVVSAPRINEAILGGSAQITGSFSQIEAQDLANVLKYGSLPLAFDRGEVQQVSPTLGNDQLVGGLIAGGLGLLLVVLYSLFYYRALGTVVIGSLIMAAAMVLISFLLLGEWVGFTLTLAGIAGTIVAIGITADSFIVYFERIRDEMRDGKPLRVAAETGWQRARRTIVVADLVSLISAVVLYIVSVGSVRGFAFTLGLTTIIDLIIIFFFTKPMVSLYAKLKFFQSGSRWSGVSPRSVGMASVANQKAGA